MKRIKISLFLIVIILLLNNNLFADKTGKDGMSIDHPKHDPGYRIVYPTGITRYSITPTDPPQAPVRMCAEWEPATSVLVRYPLGLPWNLLQSIADETPITCFVSISNQSSAQSAFTSHSIINVTFVITDTYTYWTRDYGPWGVFDGNDNYGISDHVYNRTDSDPNRIVDDQSNWDLAPALGIELWKTRLRHTGGNFMTDGHGIGFSSDDLYHYGFNDTIPHDSVNALMNNYWGIDTYHTYPDPLGSYINHIDCYAKILSDEAIIVIKNGVDDANLDAIATQIEGTNNCYGRPYKVYRIDAPDSHDAAYCNSLILNKRVYVPITGYTSEDDSAIAVYERAMPGYEILGFSDGSFANTDAIHCRTMAIFDEGMLYIDHAPLQNQLASSPFYHIDVYIKPYSGSALKNDSLFIYWKLYSGTVFNTVLLTNDSINYYSGNIPSQVDGSIVEYYVYAVDNSGRHESDPYVAPDGYYTFSVGDESPVISHQAISDYPVSEWPATVSATITDDGNIGSATVEYLYNSVPFIDTMNNISGNLYEADFSVSVSIGDSIRYKIKAVDNSSKVSYFPDTGYITFHIIDKTIVGIIDLDVTALSGPFIKNYCDSIGYINQYMTSFPADLSQYVNIFICLGVYSNNIPLNSSQANAIVDFMNSGGNVYMEGGDCWCYDANHLIYDGMFGVNPISDGEDISGNVSGVSGTFTEGMSFTYSGENSWLDEISSTGTGYMIFNEGSKGRGVANSTVLYKSVALSFELAGFVDGTAPSTRDSLLNAIFDFFEITSGISKKRDLKKEGITLNLKSNLIRDKLEVKYHICKSSDVNISIYNIAGKKVSTVFKGKVQSGSHLYSINGLNELSNGIYFIHLKTDSETRTVKFELIK